jgi:hypothetical protein
VDLLFDRVARYARRWGVSVCHSADGDYDYETVIDPAPQGGALVGYGTIRPSLVGFEQCRTAAWAWLLHDLSHALSPFSPDKCDEIRDCLGFEVMSLRFLGLPFETWEETTMHGYSVDLHDDVVEWEDLSPAHRTKLIRRAESQLIRRGHMTESGRPTFRTS